MSWGGAREGAGRKKSVVEIRKNHTLRATQEEWQIILSFADILKNIDKTAAKNFVEQYKVK